jgi:hypothetical protein
LPRKNPVGKKTIAKEKEYSILELSLVPLGCLIKTLQRKTLWEKNLSEGKIIQSAQNI